MPEKIIKQTLSEQIYNILKEDILSGRILTIGNFRSGFRFHPHPCVTPLTDCQKMD